MKTEVLIHELSTRGRPVERIEQPAVRFLRWALFSALCVGGGTVWFGLRPDVELALRSPTFLLLAGLTLALSAFSALSAFTMSVPDRTRLWYFAVPMGIVALELSVLAHALVSAEHPRAGHGITCVLKILALAIAPSAQIFLMLRKAAPLGVGRVGLLAATSAAASGTLGAQFICRYDDPLHIVAWHLLPAAIVGGLGILLGRLCLDWHRG